MRNRTAARRGPYKRREGKGDVRHGRDYSYTHDEGLGQNTAPPTPTDGERTLPKPRPAKVVGRVKRER